MEDKYRDLVQSVHHDDLDTFKSQLAKVCPDFHPRFCVYPKTLDNVIHVICQLGREHFLNAVIDAFHDECLELLEIRNADDKVPLHDAAQFSQVNVVRILLGQGVNVDPIKKADWTPLMLACTKTGSPAYELIQMLVLKGANLSLCNKDGWTPFHLAVREGDVRIIKYFLDINKELMDSKSKNGRSPLHTACLHGHIEAVQLMLGYQCQPLQSLAKRDSCGATPIMDAVRGGHQELVIYLAGLNKDSLWTEDALGRNCLHMAAYAGHANLVKSLVSDLGMDANESCTTPLHWAAKEGQSEVIKALLDIGANPEKCDANGRPPLALAIGGQHVDATRLLLAHNYLNTFDMRLLELARTADMKTCLVEAFKQWNLVLFLPGTH